MLTKLIIKNGKLVEETEQDRYNSHMENKVKNSPLNYFVKPEPIFSTINLKVSENNEFAA